MEKVNEFCQNFGLHPFVGFGMIAVDWMLFGSEAATLGVGWGVSVLVALALTPPCILIQKYSYKDSWGASAGKGLLVGVLTAIPTGLPSIVTFGGAAIGTARYLLPNKKPELQKARR
jgi:hypothetical protein